MDTLVREMPLSVFVIAIALLCATAGVAAYAAIHIRRRSALINTIPTSPVLMARDGHCELQGTVEAIQGRVLTAPLTGVSCCWYRVQVDEWASPDGGASRWVSRHEAASEAPFFLRDATGVCAVDPYGAIVTSTDLAQWTGASAVPVDRRPERHPVTWRPRPTVGDSTDARYRYSEWCIYPGDPLFVLGEFSGRRLDAEEEPGDEGDSSADSIDAGDGDDVESAVEHGAENASPYGDDSALTDDLTTRASRITGARISKGDGARPFIVAATHEAIHVQQTAVGKGTALLAASIPLLVAAVLAWMRFGG